MYAANLISVLVFSVMAERYRSRSPFNVKQNRRLPVMAFTIAVIASFQILAGFRFDVGTDYYNYSIIYSDIVNHGAEFISSDKIDIGFVALCKTLAVFTDKPFAMFFITALAINTLTVLELRRRSSSFWLSCLMFILTFCFYTTLNIIRQSIAVAIVFSANRFVINRKFMPYCVCVVFASLFHLTALVMIPAYFILIKPSWSNTTLITVIAAAVVFALFSVFQTSVIALAQNTRYGGMVGDNERGVSVIRVIFTVIPIIPAFIWRKILRKQEPYYDLIVNQYILASLITVISLKTVYLARISEYFYISILLLLPMYIKISKDRVKNALMCVVVVVFFGAFYVISLMTNVEDANLIPYQSVFSLPDNWAVADDIAVR